MVTTKFCDGRVVSGQRPRFATGSCGCVCDNAGMPGKRYPRTARLNEVILEVIATELERMSDPRLEMVTITGVDVLGDLSKATCYFSAMTSPNAQAALDAVAPHLRKVLGDGMRVRAIPKLVFVPDPSIDTGARIEAILRDGGRRTDTLDDDE